MIEARESRGDGLDLRVELVVGNQPVDVSVLLRARSIEIVGHEEDLECPAATDQAGEPSHRTAPGNHTDANFPLAEKRVLARGEPQITGENELAPGAAGAPPDRGDADHRGTSQTDKDVDPGRQSSGTDPSASVLRGSFSKS